MSSVVQCGGLVFLVTKEQVIVIHADSIGDDLKAQDKHTQPAIPLDSSPTAITATEGGAGAHILFAAATSNKTVCLDM